MGAEGGATVGGEPPPLERLALGGALRLESYGESALRARHVVLGRAAYFLDLGRVPEWAGGRAWILAAGQAGSAFDAAAAARLAWSAGLALAADTRLGAASVGAFVGSADTYQARFTLGRLFP